MKKLFDTPKLFQILLISNLQQPNAHQLQVKQSQVKQLQVKQPQLKNRGFTLVEVMVVVVILSIFAGVISLSVGSSESRKNLAFYEHLIDSLQYVRLLSAERMQPMGLSLQANNQGQVTPVIMSLSHPYAGYQNQGSSNTAKNNMELSALSTDDEASTPTPAWQVEPAVTLPKLPNDVKLNISPLDVAAATNASNATSNADNRTLQPWFMGQNVPQVLWFGTGEAAPVTIEVLYNSRPVGEVITVEANGNIKVGQL